VTDTAASPDLAADLDLALRLADTADRISLGHFRDRELHVETKPDRSPVTEADLAVERALRETLASERPEDGILGEEYGTEGDTARQWIVDPIDGTANYLRGVPVWGTLIALAIDGTPRVGVVSSPALGRRWWAAVGSGAWTTDAPGAEARAIRVSGVSDLEHASLSFQSIAQWDEAGYLDRLVALTRRTWRDRAYGDMWSYMLLAEGLVDAVGEFGVKTYDLAALIPIVEEAGGRFTSVDGTPGPGNGSALASNGLLHPALLEALAY
jgi:histidinol-phosphatase